MQEDKEGSFDAMDTAAACLRLFTGMIASMRFRNERMAASAAGGFTNATDAADYLVRKGVPFRDAHGIVGRMVLACMEKGCALDALSMEELRGFCDQIDEDFYEAVSLETCVQARLTAGGPGPEAIEAYLKECKAYLS
jgi:argininosuccinate lyase